MKAHTSGLATQKVRTWKWHISESAEPHPKHRVRERHANGSRKQEIVAMLLNLSAPQKLSQNVTHQNTFLLSSCHCLIPQCGHASTLIRLGCNTLLNGKVRRSVPGRPNGRRGLKLTPSLFLGAFLQALPCNCPAVSCGTYDGNKAM